MSIGETQNLESSDLIVLSCCNLGGRVTAIAVLPSDTPRLLIATESRQYIEVVSFVSSPNFETIYTALETHVQSLGRLSSSAYRTVALGHCLFPAPVMPSLDLLKMFMQLDESAQATIVSAVGMNVDDARAICAEVLSCVRPIQKDRDL
jgi:hypothetical protein